MATINGTAGKDTLTGDDVDLLGNGGDDTIHGLAGNDTIDGLGGSNHLFGDDGDDTFVISKFTPGTTLVDTSYDGGAGFDTLDISRSGPTDQATITQLDDFWVLQTTGQFSINSIRNVEQ